MALIKSRRRIAFLKAQDCADWLITVQLQQGFVTDEIGGTVSLHSSNPGRSMSALGQKQTFPNVRPMSALPPKADIATRSRNVRYVPKADIGHPIGSPLLRKSVLPPAWRDM
jgi:hypothetical protein